MRALEVKEINSFACKFTLLICKNKFQKRLISSADRCFRCTNTAPIMIDEYTCRLGFSLSTIGFGYDIIGSDITHGVNIGSSLIEFITSVILPKQCPARAIHHKRIGK